MEWHEMSEAERVKNIYGKHTIAEFFSWWSNEQDKWMEVRIKDMDLIKEVASKLSLGYSASGVYVHNADSLKKVIAYARDKAVIWFGTNPRKKNHGKYLDGKVFGGGDNFIESINFLFIDIDRTIKETFATNEELANCDRMANLIIEKLGAVGWNKNYMKVCSGNGIQLIIRLDIPILLPECEFIWKTRVFRFNQELEHMKVILRKGIGREISKFAEHYKKELKCDVDTTCFRISQVASLPFTKNFKYGGFRWRGIVELVNEGPNTGLTDYLMSKKVVEENKYEVFVKSSRVSTEMRLIKGKIAENPLTRLFLDYKLPKGQRNNIAFFQYQVLIRDSGIDTNSEEFRDIYNQIKIKQGDAFPLSVPPERNEFNPDAVNNYCLNVLINPIYPLWPRRTVVKEYLIGKITYDMMGLAEEEMSLEEGDTFLQEFDIALKQLKEITIIKSKEKESVGNRIIFASFLKSFLKKHGEATTKFFIKYKIFEELFCKK
jgi:hypothetical protein